MIVIDLREEHELKEKHLQSVNADIINIPMRSIEFNKNYIRNLAKDHKVYLVCKSGNRSSRVKSKHFPNIANVISYEGGVNNMKLDDLKVVESGKVRIGIQQYMQIMFAIILVISSVILMFTNKLYTLGFNAVMVIFIMVQLYTKSCVLGKFLMLFN